MKNKIVLTMLAMVAAVSVMGCSFSSTQTYTETTTDADGNTVTTTTTTTNGNTTTETTESVSEEAVEEVESFVATVVFDNETNFDFNELYFASNLTDNWGDEILGSNAPLAVGEMITYDNALTYSSNDMVWDIKAVDVDGNELEFTGADLSVASDANNIGFLFTYDETDGSYTVTIQ